MPDTIEENVKGFSAIHFIPPCTTPEMMGHSVVRVYFPPRPQNPPNPTLTFPSPAGKNLITRRTPVERYITIPYPYLHFPLLKMFVILKTINPPDPPINPTNLLSSIVLSFFVRSSLG